MKLTLPLRLPDIFNIYSTVGFLKENDIVLSFIKPREIAFLFVGARIPRTLRESNLKFIYSFSNGTIQSTSYVYKYLALQLRIN